MVKGKLISVLIVGEDNAFRTSLVDACKQMRLSVHLASDGNSGWRNFLRAAPHSVVTDLHMPNGDGIHLLKHIKAISPVTPVFIVTGDLGVYSGEKTLKLAEKVYHKPFDSVDLVRHIIERCAPRT